MKKLLSLAICLCMLFGVLAMAVSAAQYNPDPAGEHNLTVSPSIMKNEDFSMGDVNCDGAVDAKDALYMTANIKGITGYTMDSQASDFNADGTFDAKDLYYEKLCLSGASSPANFGDDLQIYKLTIGGKDIAGYSIVIPEDAVYESNLYMAAEIIYEYVKEATGIALPIERGTASGEGGIYFHHVTDDSELGVSLGHEGYKYYVENGDLHIYGTHRGNMYAAYEIVEDYLGFNFFSKEGTYSKKMRTVDIPEDLERFFVPPLRFRHSKSTFGGGNAREYFYIARGLNGAQNYNYKNEPHSLDYLGGFVGPVFVNIHSYAYYWQMGTGTMPADDGTMALEERYFAKLQSGEYQDETTWEPCATNNDDFAILFSGFLDTIRMVEARGYPIHYQDKTNCFSFSANDNDHWCGCRNCKKASNTKTYTGVYLDLASRGAREIQAYYPGLDVFTWIYTREMPTNVTPDEHLVIVLSGFNCANHHLGEEVGCVKGSFFGHTNKEFEERIIKWDDLCDESGAEFWLWYYPETHYYYMFDIPNIYTIFYDVKWLCENGLTGLFYEGSGGKGYLFENMKAYLASQIMFDPSMTLEEYDQLIKDYCMMAYGNGWEYIYEFIQMYEEAGDAVGREFDENAPSYCYIGNYDRAYDFVSAAYLQENYETMRNLLLSAIEAFDEDQTEHDDYRKTRLNNLFNCFEILGLGATYLTNYVNGTDEQRAEYEARYTAFFNYSHNNGLQISANADPKPDSIDLSVNPAITYLIAASRRADVNTILLGVPEVGYY